MIFTIFYMYATFLQWWRLGTLKNKLNGTLNAHNAIMVCDHSIIFDSTQKRSFENLLFRNGDRVGCTIVPVQKINLSQWLAFPADLNSLPIHFKPVEHVIETPCMYVYLQAILDHYVKNNSDFIEVERYGELVAWRSSNNFEAILKTDIDKLTKLVHCFSKNDLDINHDLKLLKVETVDIEGSPSVVKLNKKFSLDDQLKFSHSPVHWKKFTEEMRDIYSKIKTNSNPKITIENGHPKKEEAKKIPVSEVKPMKKDTKKEDKYTLDVGQSEYRHRHKSKEKNTKKIDSEAKKIDLEVKVSREAKKTDLEAKKTDLEAKKNDLDAKTSKETKKTDTGANSTKEEVRAKNTTEKMETTVPKLDIETPSCSKTQHKEESKRKEFPIKIPRIKKESCHEVDSSLKKEEKASKKTEKKIESDKKNKEKLENKGKEREKTPDKDKKRDKTPDKDKKKGKTLDKDKKRDKTPDKKREKTPEKDKTSENEKKKEKKDRRKLLLDAFKSDKSKKVEELSPTPKETKVFETINNGNITHNLSQHVAAVSSSNASSSSIVHNSSNLPSSSSVPNSSSNGSVMKNGAVKTGTKNDKPPNILLYADSLIGKDNVKEALNELLNKDKYTIYDLPKNTNINLWNSSTALVVVCGTVSPDMTNQLLQYLLNGGQLLCLCSDLLYSVLHTFSTAEVREHELVRFSYSEWKQVKMMHHIFCYQASPAKKQFSRESEHSNPSSGNGSSPIAPRTPSTVEIEHNGKEYKMHVQVLGTEETWHTPSLLLATVRGSSGRAIFSQVHLEINPNQFEEDENKFSALKESNQARIEILKDLLSKHLNIDCSSHSVIEKYTPAYFLGRHDLKLKMLSECESIQNQKIKNKKLTITFCGKNDTIEDATDTNLPVLVHSCPSNFSTVNYFETLNTDLIGRLVIYADVMTSSQVLLEQTLTHGLVVIPRQQTHGTGRSNNTWISPLGSLMFSMQLHIALETPLGQSLSLVQHMVMVAIISAIKSYNGCQDIPINIKWPNDLYAGDSQKIGGTILNSIIIGNEAVINIGAGINLDNSNPTTCINDLIISKNQVDGTCNPTIPYETCFALIFNEIEKMLKIVQDGNFDYFFELYYKYWLHNGQEIMIKTEDGVILKAKVLGIDDYGYLRVRKETGKITTVQPDGNSFDMMKGLIAPKVF